MQFPLSWNQFSSRLENYYNESCAEKRSQFPEEIEDIECFINEFLLTKRSRARLGD